MGQLLTALGETELTFIVLARPQPSIPLVTSDDIRKYCPMAGDVNLFFKPGDSETEPEVECEVMIAGSIPEISIPVHCD